MKVAVASNNPVKQAAARSAFEQAFGQPVELIGSAVPSGVRDQPLTDEETRQGALNRALRMQEKHPEADYWVGIEGGVAPADENGMEAFGWMAVLNKHRQSLARSASFLLPNYITVEIRAGHELGPTMDVLFNEENTKHKGGAVGLLTNSLVSREALYTQPLLLALIPYLQPDKY